MQLIFFSEMKFIQLKYIGLYSSSVAIKETSHCCFTLVFYCQGGIENLVAKIKGFNVNWPESIHIHCENIHLLSAVTKFTTETVSVGQKSECGSPQRSSPGHPEFDKDMSLKKMEEWL